MQSREWLSEENFVKDGTGEKIMSDTYKGKASLSKEKTIRAWQYENIGGMTRVAVAFKFHVSEQTLYRMYKHYGLPSPKRRK